MTRRVFFSFKYEDVQRANVVRNSWAVQKDRAAAGFIDAADFEKIERQGDKAIQNWIDSQMNGTSVTAVLVGADTGRSRWVKYEIEQSKERGNGLLGINISNIRDWNSQISSCCGRMPAGHPFYDWVNDHGNAQLGSWIEYAAKQAGR